MSDVDKALAEAKDWLSAKETGNLNYLCTRLASALLALHREHAAMAAVVEAAMEWRKAPPGFDGPERTLSDAAEVQLTRALDALAREQP